MTELKCCPFCGGEAIIKHVNEDEQRYYDAWRPYCIDCRASLNDNIYGFNSKKEAIEAWNKRVKS